MSIVLQKINAHGIRRAHTSLVLGFSVLALAAMYFTSEVQFRADFRRAYGTSPVAYIKERRIAIAKTLPESNLYSVAEVAIRAGFDSISYFSSEFRRVIGFSPREYCRR